MKKIIFDFAAEHDLLAGICDAEAIKVDKSIFNRAVPFIENNPDRLNAKAIMADGKSIIVLGYKYNKKLNFDVDSKIRGNISIGAIGVDYHLILKEYMDRLCHILNNAGEFKFVNFVDTGPLMEREIAKKAGIGWQGKNNNIINPYAGSFIYLGCIITDLKLEPSSPYENSDSQCGNCNRCIVACPGKAIKENYEINYNYCVSYLTQKKGLLTDREMEIMGNSIYGCDICQKVCPYNLNTYIDIVTDPELKFPDLNMFLNMSNSEFKALYGATACYWRGRKTLKRNALIALGNSRNLKGIEIINDFLDNDDEVIRYTAKWAKNKILLNN